MVCDLLVPCAIVVFNPFRWANEGARFPHISLLARRFLVIPATSAPIERVWSTAGRVVTEARNRLKPDLVSAVVVCHENFEYIDHV